MQTGYASHRRRIGRREIVLAAALVVVSIAWYRSHCFTERLTLTAVSGGTTRDFALASSGGEVLFNKVGPLHVLGDSGAVWYGTLAYSRENSLNTARPPSSFLGFSFCGAQPPPFDFMKFGIYVPYWFPGVICLVCAGFRPTRFALRRRAQPGGCANETVGHRPEENTTPTESGSKRNKR